MTSVAASAAANAGRDQPTAEANINRAPIEDSDITDGDAGTDHRGEESNDDDDSVVAEYDVYITPDMPKQLLYVMQFINRDPSRPMTKAIGSHPTEVRVKKASGFVEVDVPIDTSQNYDRVAGVNWGEALRKTKGFGQKAYGIASGFERTMPRANGRSGAGDGPSTGPVALEDDNIEEYVNNFEDAKEKGHVLSVQTFGGQVLPNSKWGPSHALGTFRNNELHLTRLDDMVQLRTQLHHIDAAAQLEAVARRREKESQEGAKPAEPKAFLPTVRQAGGDTAAEMTQAFMKATHQEAWNTLQYHDEDSYTAFDTYNERVFLQNAAEAPKLQSGLTDSGVRNKISCKPAHKGKGKATTTKRAMPDPIPSDDSDNEGIEIIVS